jgi:hypothetical protein
MSGFIPHAFVKGQCSKNICLKKKGYFGYFGDLERWFDSGELIVDFEYCISAILDQNPKRGGTYLTDLLRNAFHINKL